MYVDAKIESTAAKCFRINKRFSIALNKPVSYTHLDVYKRQMLSRAVVFPQPAREAAGDWGSYHERGYQGSRGSPQQERPLVHESTPKLWAGVHGLWLFPTRRPPNP